VSVSVGTHSDFLLDSICSRSECALDSALFKGFQPRAEASQFLIGFLFTKISRTATIALCRAFQAG